MTSLETLMSNHCTSRRAALGLVAGALLTPVTIALAPAQARPRVTMHRDPSCGCCGDWAAHLMVAGFPVAIADTARINAVKARLGVPQELWSCHTAEVGGYIIEGHVPSAAIDRLLAEKPEAAGLAVPGMPAGSPGMEGGEPDIYEVVLFGPQGRRVFARYRGEREL